MSMAGKGRERTSIWRRRRPGPAGAMAVLLPADGGDRPSPDDLRALMRGGYAGLDPLDAGLDGSPASLAVLDRLIDGWTDDARSRMSPAVGAYLGTVLVDAGAEWRVGPGGRPFVVSGPGREIDVMELARRRIERGRPRLTDLAP